MAAMPWSCCASPLATEGHKTPGMALQRRRNRSGPDPDLFGMISFDVKH